MNKKKSSRVFLSLLVGFASVTVLASGSHDAKHEDNKTTPMVEMKSDGEEMHGHKSWVDAPHSYEKYNGYLDWNNVQSADRGDKLYQENCLACHGNTGRGDGATAGSLEHKPADLTKNFHRMNGSNDSYLFWRVSEGGTVEPFKSQNSLMPAFKDVLSNQQRWDILTYLHLEFHGGFVETMVMGSMENSDEGHEN